LNISFLPINPDAIKPPVIAAVNRAVSAISSDFSFSVRNSLFNTEAFACATEVPIA
jgi:hypothetical protein